MKTVLQPAQIRQHGMPARSDGPLAETERSHQMVRNRKRDDFDALHLLGVRWQPRRHDDASKLIKQILRLGPDSAEASANLGIVLQLRDRPN